MTAKRRETNVLRIMHLLSITGFGKVGNIFILVLIFTLEYIKEMINIDVNVNIRMYNFDDVQCTVIPSVAYGFVTGMNLQLC